MKKIVLCAALITLQPLLCNFGKMKTYVFSDEPIDVVIPTATKDVELLDLCIEGIKKNGERIRDVYVVSDKKLTDNALWFDEKKFPFSKRSIAVAIFNGNQAKADEYMQNPWHPSRVKGNGMGWIFQQLLKLYAVMVIPNISSNILILDSDTIFLNSVSFLNEKNEPLLNPGTEYYESYFTHAKALIPGFRKLYSQHSGISHHMIMQRPVIEHLLETIQNTHQMEAWKAFCHAIYRIGFPDLCCSEYEMYFNFILSTTDQAHIRPLKWSNGASVEQRLQFQRDGYHYASFHHWLRAPEKYKFVDPLKKKTKEARLQQNKAKPNGMNPARLKHRPNKAKPNGINPALHKQRRKQAKPNGINPALKHRRNKK